MYTLYLELVDPMLQESMFEVSGENAGIDLYACDTLDTNGLLNLGVKAVLYDTTTDAPSAYWLAPRSSIYKTGFIMHNSLGVIDASYRGVLKAPVAKIVDGAVGFQAGNRYFQILTPTLDCISRIVFTENVEARFPSVRGQGGFGSTGLTMQSK